MNTPATDHEFKDIIRSLELLRTVKPDAAFRARMERKMLVPSPSRFAMPFFALRIAMLVFIVLLSGTGIVAAASQSKPGEMLYPVKQMVDSVKTNFTPEAEITKTPTPLPKKHNEEKAPANDILEVTPTPTSPVIKQQNQTLPSSEENKPPLPTPTPTQQGILPAVQNTVNQVIQNVPGLPIGNTQPTPTPQPTNEGSKDNGSDAGAGGSLLPKINIGL